MGDLNSGWKVTTGQHGDCALWAERFDLNNQPYDVAKNNGVKLVIHSVGNSHINHILTSNYKLLCTQLVSTEDQIAHDISDHYPLVADFACHNIRTKPPYIPTPEKHIDLKIGKNVTNESFEKWMNDSNCPRHPGQDASSEEIANYLDDLTAYAVSGAALASKSFSKKKFFHGWSPQLMANIYHMQFLMGLKRQIDRWQTTRGWTPTAWIEASVLRFLNRVRSTQKDTSLTPDISSVTIDGFKLTDWTQETSISRMCEIFKYHREVVRKRLHVDYRLQDRMTISEYTKQNMKRFHDKKYKNY